MKQTERDHVYLWMKLLFSTSVLHLDGCMYRAVWLYKRGAWLYGSVAQLYVDALTGCMVYASTSEPANSPALEENKKWKKKFCRFISDTFAII